MDGSTHGQHAYRIVVIEDDINPASILRYNFEACGHAVMWISDGAATLVGLSVEPPEAVIPDWELPGLAGIDILRRMRMSTILRDVPVLILTARLPEDRQRAFDTGATAFLAFSVHDVVDTLHRIVVPSNSRRPMQAAGALG